MKVILIKDLNGKGKKGDVITVNDGYAANFLFPNGYAESANATNLSVNQNAKASQQHKEDLVLQAAKELGAKLNNTTINLNVKCGETGKVFGSITSKEIAGELSSLGFAVDKKKIELDSPIKNVGLYTLKVKLHTQVSVKILVDVKSN